MTLSLADYTGLQATALDFMERTGVTADVAAAPVWIQLGEARLNRDLPAVETETTLTGVVNSRQVSISSLSIAEPIALYVVDTATSDELPVELVADGSFAYLSTATRPSQAAIVGTNLTFDVPCDAAYSFRLVYRQLFALSSGAPTNWLLTNHPDVYLAATMMWGAGYHTDWANGSQWVGLLSDAIPAIRTQIAASKRGAMQLDPMLAMIGRRPLYTGSSP